MAIDISRFGNALLEEDNIDNATLADEPFAGLDLRKARCFSFAVPKESGWKFMADQAEDVGWKLIDAQRLEKSLAKDVEDSYLAIAQFTLENVDDGLKYSLVFDNNKALWQLEILDSPKAEMTIEERADFFKSEMFKKIANKVYRRLDNALKTFNKNVKPSCDKGELLLVDTIKLEAILSFLESERFMKNLMDGKYLDY